MSCPHAYVVGEWVGAAASCTHAYFTTLACCVLRQIYVEVERARLTLMLSRIFEEEGNVKQASETLQEVAVCSLCTRPYVKVGVQVPSSHLRERMCVDGWMQVETFGAMEKREKAEFLLEQVRLCLTQRDFVRMQIIANKVSKKVLDEEGFEVRTALTPR